MSRVRTLVATEFLLLLGLIAFVLIAFGLERVLSPGAPVALGPFFALLMALVPALLWLGYFCSRDNPQDKLKPNPKRFVIGVALLGGFVAAPSASFLVDLATLVPGHSVEMHTLTTSRWVYAIAIVGLAQEACKYIVVRYTIYVSDDFGEPIDGVIYMSAVGIGLATYESLELLRATGNEIFLSAAAMQCAVTALAHASFAGVMGFALGMTKSAPADSGMGAWLRAHQSVLVAGALCSAALLNGGFRMIMDGLGSEGIEGSPWRQILFSFGFAAGSFLLISVAMRRHLSSSHQEGSTSADALLSPRVWQGHDLSVLLVALAFFAGGTLLSRHLVSPSLVNFDEQGLHFVRPSGWLPGKAPVHSTSTSLAAPPGLETVTSVGEFHLEYRSFQDAKTRIEVRITAHGRYGNLRGIRALERLSRYGEFYWEEDSHELSIAKRDWLRTTFRYAFKSSKSGTPQIVHAVEYARIQDKKQYVVTLHGSPQAISALDDIVARTLLILNSP